MGEADDSLTRAADLLELFHPRGSGFADVRSVAAADVPEPYRTLLDHRSHMTVAMERHHGGPVTLRVVRVAEPGAAGTRYAREILLERPAGTVVQYGIVRLDLGAVDAGTGAAIRDASMPLGRLLIEAGLLRDVHHVRLLQIMPGPDLCELFGRHECPPTYGRVAEISLAGRPAVELLEIAAPR